MIIRRRTTLAESSPSSTYTGKNSGSGTDASLSRHGWPWRCYFLCCLVTAIVVWHQSLWLDVTRVDYNRNNGYRSDLGINRLLDKKCAPFAVLVLSNRNNAKRRATIRDTWGKRHRLYFVIGLPDTADENVDIVRKEQESFRDLIDAEYPESYASLPYKLKYGLRWIALNCKSTQWIFKADDDMYARIEYMKAALLHQGADPPGGAVVGRIQKHTVVQRHGKWKEQLYSSPTYPFWPQGSCGYVVNQRVAEFVCHHFDSLPLYQGEDTSLGIWLEHNNVQWINSSTLFVNHGDCMLSNHENETTPLSIGHRITPEHMRKCYLAGDTLTNADLVSVESDMKRAISESLSLDMTNNTTDDAYVAAMAQHESELLAVQRDVEGLQRRRARAEKRQQRRAQQQNA